MLSRAQGRPLQPVQDVNIVGGGSPFIPSTPVVTDDGGAYIDDDVSHTLNGGVAFEGGTLYWVQIVPETAANTLRGWLCLGGTAVAWAGPLVFGGTEKSYEIRLVTPQLLSFIRDSGTGEPYKVQVVKIDSQHADFTSTPSADAVVSTDQAKTGFIRWSDNPVDAAVTTDGQTVTTPYAARRPVDASVTTDGIVRVCDKEMAPTRDNVVASDAAAPEIWK